MKFFFIAIILFSSFLVQGQNIPQVEEFATSILTIRKQDSLSGFRMGEVTGFIINISFKADSICDKNKINVKIGSNQNQGQIVDDKVKVIYHDPTHPEKKCIHTDDSQNREVNQIHEEKILLSYKIDMNDLPNVKWVTVFISDNNNNESQKKYCNIQ